MLDAGLVLTLALLAGRVAGLLRELTLATVFGVSPKADAAVLLLTLPDLFVNLLVSGGLSAALVPRLSALGAGGAKALLRQASVAVLVLFSLIGMTLMLWPQGILQLLAPGLAFPYAAAGIGIAAVALAVPLTGLAGVAGAYLNAQQRYFVTGCGTLIFNVGVLAALFMSAGSAEPLTWLGVGIAVGAMLRWMAQLAVIPTDSWVTSSAVPVADRALLRAFGAATLATALMLLAPLLIRAMASLLGAGAIASFNYAQKLVELPVAILITSISTVALSRLSLFEARGQVDAARAVAVRDTRYAILLSIAVMLLGLWFADSVVQVLFGRGQMDEVALARVVYLTRIALLAVPMAAVSSMAAARLNASAQTTRLLQPTVGALLLLPVLAAPGLYLGSEAGLMAAVVGFQAIIAVWLARVSDLPLFGASAVIDLTIWRFAAMVVGAAVLTAGIDIAISPHNDWVRLILAGVGFGLTWVPIKHFLRASPLPQLPSTP